MAKNNKPINININLNQSVNQNQAANQGQSASANQVVKLNGPTSTDQPATSENPVQDKKPSWLGSFITRFKKTTIFFAVSIFVGGLIGIGELLSSSKQILETYHGCFDEKSTNDSTSSNPKASPQKAILENASPSFWMLAIAKRKTHSSKKTSHDIPQKQKKKPSADIPQERVDEYVEKIKRGYYDSEK